MLQMRVGGLFQNGCGAARRHALTCETQYHSKTLHTSQISPHSDEDFCKSEGSFTPILLEVKQGLCDISTSIPRAAISGFTQCLYAVLLTDLYAACSFRTTLALQF